MRQILNRIDFHVLYVGAGVTAFLLLGVVAVSRRREIGLGCLFLTALVVMTVSLMPMILTRALDRSTRKEERPPYLIANGILILFFSTLAMAIGWSVK